MDINLQELRQVVPFKDSVLSAADAQRAGIIAAAQKAGDEVVESARAMCQLADHDVIAAKYAMDTERQAAAATQAVHKELLDARQALVEGLFRELEEKLLAFSKSAEYGGWLAKKLTAHTGAFAAQSDVTVYLRAADMDYAGALKAALPGYTVQRDDSIRLGGLKVTDGRLLFDETLDTALADEQDRFYTSSGLTL